MSKFIDLFAGTGAFSYVFEKNGFECVFANDMISSSKNIYELNNTNVFCLQDLNTVNVQDIPQHDILCGGFSCQPFSIAGKQLGFNDERANVFWKIVEILKHYKPSIIILENVKNLQSHDKGNTFKIIMENLTNIGYHMKIQILDTCKITKIPQHRERIYMVGFLDEEKAKKFNFEFPLVENYQIKDLLENEIPDKYYYHSGLKVYNTVVENVTKHINENTLYQYRRYYVRENKSNCCPTLTANMGGGGHNVPLLKDDRGVRKLTPRECFNLQGFPSDYQLPPLSDSALYKLAGNAVSVPIIELIVEKLKQI
jgi:DNA (cytosine-5)-methyltransferase 1